MSGRVEIITGPERRRRWSEEEKLQLVEEACRPGHSVSQVARQRGINASQLFAWRRQALAKGLVTDNRSEPLFDIERTVNGLSIKGRLRVRQEQSRPLVDALETWLREERSRLSRSASVAKPIDYLLRRWDRFTRFLGDGRICLTNNAAERALRGFAMPVSFCTPSSSVWKH